MNNLQIIQFLPESKSIQCVAVGERQLAGQKTFGLEGNHYFKVINVVLPPVRVRCIPRRRLVVRVREIPGTDCFIRAWFARRKSHP